MNAFIKYCANLIFIISVIFLSSNCNINRQDPPNRHKLLLKNSINISVPEPSGLSFSYDRKNLWVVSDQNSTVYLMSLTGKIVKSFKVNYEDLEGVTVIDSIRLAIIAERTREIVVLDTSGREITNAKLNLKGRLNEGLEGICYDKDLNKFILVNEKNPGLLIQTNFNLDMLSKIEIKYAKDNSGLSYDPFDKSLWALSDESGSFYRINEKGEVIEEYKIFIDQPEGIAVDVQNKKVFIVSDRTEKLYEYDLP